MFLFLIKFKRRAICNNTYFSTLNFFSKQQQIHIFDVAYYTIFTENSDQIHLISKKIRLIFYF